MKQILLLMGFMLLPLLLQAQSIFSGEPVQVVGSMNGYSTAASSNSAYRKVSTASTNPNNGRGQWFKTYNVQSSGGDFAPINMTGGGSNGFLFISGPVSNRYNNKWAFSGTGSASVNAVNAASAYNSGNDMGLNMNTAGRYTFVFNDAGYTATNAKFYVAYTINAPVGVSRTSENLSFDRSATVGITTTASPSTGENIYVRYTTAADFTGSTTVVQATGSGTVWSAAIPSQEVSSTVRYYIFTSTISLATLNGMSEMDKSLSVLNYDDNGNSNFSYVLTSAFTSAQSGNFTASSTWGGNQIFQGASYTIANLHIVTLNADVSVSGITVNSGGTFVASDVTPRTLTITNSGSITNNGTFTAGNGTVTFAGSGTVTGTVGFNNVGISGGVNFGTASTIGSGGSLLLNAGGFINTNAPFYNSNSTLIYNINGNYGRGLEWSATTGRGYPGNVQIGNGSNNTVLDLSANGGTNTARQCAGNLTVSSGSTLTLSNMSQPLTIKGKYTNSGTTVLSSAGGGDLKLEGDMDDNGVFTANTRAIFFEGANNQTINSSTNPLDIDVMRIGKNGGEVILAQNLLVDETNDPIQFTTASSVLNLNDKNATFGKANAASVITMNGSSSIKGSASSSLTVLGTGAFGTINFDQSNPGTTNLLGNLTLNRTGSGAVTLGSTLVVNSDLIIGSQTTINNGILDLKGVLTDNRSTKTYNGTIQYSGTNQSIVAGTYNNLSLLNSGTKTFGGDTTISGNFLITDATVVAPNTMSFNGATAQNIAGLDYNNIAFSGIGAKTFTSNASISAAASIAFSGTGASIDFDGTSNDLNFVLKSDSAGTASVNNASNWTLNGKVTVERFIPAKRAWRILAAPLTGASSNSITANWQGTAGEGLLLFSPSTFQSQTMVGYTTGGTAPNIRKYNAGWQNITNLTTEPMFGTSATDSKPFLVFATGASDSNNIVTGAGATTLRPKGQLITGTVSHTGLAVGTYYALANPYASAINPISLIANNAGHKLWLVEPSLGTAGGYVTFDGTNWSVPVIGNNAFIQSGQGFFVRSGTATSFTIAETHKVSGSSNTWFEKNAMTSATTNADRIRVLLYKQLDNEWKLADGTLSVNYTEGSNEVNALDSNKISNFNESIMFRNNTSSLSIEHRALPIASEIQPIRLTGTTALPYQLRVKTENYSNSNLLPVLEDTLAGTFNEIPTDGSELVIPFTGAVSTSTNPDNRFRIVYQTNLSNVETSVLRASVFPNPVTNNQLNIHLGNNNEPANYTITNLLGQVVQNGSLNNTQNVITIATANQGFYILNITQEGKLFTTKIYVR